MDFPLALVKINGSSRFGMNWKKSFFTHRTSSAPEYREFGVFT
jgi:hypothetical protein